jgi:hypothetical protein
MNNWYVYRHIRLDKNEPFYIGIGNKKNYTRAYEKHNSKRNLIWNRITAKSLYDVEILFSSVSKEFASSKEKEFIKLYGRIDNKTGILCNMTDGGDGICNYIASQETRNKIRNSKIGIKNPMYGKKQSQETLLKRGVFNKKSKMSNEIKRNHSLATIKSGQAIETALINYDTKEVIGIFHSISEALRQVGLDPQKYSGKASIIARGVSNRKKLKGYTFKYIKNI